MVDGQFSSWKIVLPSSATQAKRGMLLEQIRPLSTGEVFLAVGRPAPVESNELLKPYPFWIIEPALLHYGVELSFRLIVRRRK